MRKPLSYNFRPPILASKINQQIMFFPTRFLDRIIFIFYFFFKNWSIVGPLQHPMRTKAAPQIRQVAPKLRKPRSLDGPKTRSWNNLAPDTPIEATCVTFFMMFEEFWILSGPMLNDFRCILASLLVLNSGIRPKRQKPETMQNTCRDLARNC